jgi:hypothetical protein
MWHRANDRHPSCLTDTPYLVLDVTYTPHHEMTFLDLESAVMFVLDRSMLGALVKERLIYFTS